MSQKKWLPNQEAISENYFFLLLKQPTVYVISIGK